MTKGITSCELAKICGVSQGTVDRALNNRAGISNATKKKILDAAARYGYLPNIHASKLAGGKSTLIGVVVFDLKNEYFSELVYAIDSCCRKLGCTSITMFSGKDKEEELFCVKKLISMGVDGLILCPINKTEALEPLKTLKLPAVTVGNRAEGIPYCGVDDLKAMEQLTECACRENSALLYYSPALLSPDDDNCSAQKLRCEGFCRAVERQGIPSRICTGLQEIEAVLAKWGTDPAPGIVCSSDYYALQLVAAFPSLPIYSFDHTRLLALTGKPVTAVGVDAQKVAERAVRAVLEGREEDLMIPYEISCK